ncbi:MAG: restriction endonuclease [Methylobacteriaceae bacterium]|nr:restriction endonuclease [Methylobacteriaceae bacterium]
MVPAYQQFYMPVLEAMKDGGIYNRLQVAEKAADIMGLAESDKAERIPSGGDTTYMNRAGWAMSYLKQAGALVSQKRSQWKITERGLELLKKYPSGFSNEQLQQFREFVSFTERRRTRSGQSLESGHDLTDLTEAGSVDELIDAAVENNLANISADLVNKLKDYNPYAFEELCVDLLLAMGYGGSRREFAAVTKKSGDGGIDGLVKQDALGLRNIYIQAKRWSGAVTEKVVRDFLGALAADKVADGVIITTGQFIDGAKKLAESANANISLIDGNRIVELMIKYHVGVEVARTVEIVKVNEDYFESL